MGLKVRWRVVRKARAGGVRILEVDSAEGEAAVRDRCFGVSYE